MAKKRNTQNTFAQGAADLVQHMSRIESKIDLVLKKLDGKSKHKPTKPLAISGNRRGTGQIGIPMRDAFQRWMRAEGYTGAVREYPTYLTNVADLQRIPLRTTPIQFYRNTNLENIEEFIDAIPTLDLNRGLTKKYEAAARLYRRFLTSRV